MQERKILITKNRAIFGFALLLLLFLVWFFFRYTWLTINLSSETTMITITTQHSENTIVEIPNAKQSETIFLPRGTYTIRAEFDNMQSYYTRSLGFFINTVDVELRPQQTSQYVGIYDYPCIRSRENELLFFSCGSRDSGEFIQSDSRGLLARALPERSETSQEVFTSEATLQPYLDGFLSAWKEGDDSLILVPRELIEYNDIITIKGFRGNITADMFYTSANSNYIAIYDNNNNELFIAEGLDDQPTKISLDEYSFLDGYEQKVVATENFVYLFSFIEDLHPEHDLLVGRADTPPQNNQVILIFDAEKKQLTEKIFMQEDEMIMRVAVGYHNKLYIGSIDGDGWQNTLVHETERKSYNELAINPQQVCWINEDSFYYLSNNSDMIYQHSLKERASFLVYSGINNRTINDLRCDNGNLYFNFDYISQRVAVTDELYGYHYYQLGDEGFKGRRLEDVIPFFVLVGGEGGDIVKVNQSSDGLLVEEHLFTDDTSPPDKNTVNEAIIKELEDEFVETDNLNLIFDF